MIPGDALTEEALRAAFLVPQNDPAEPLLSYASGGAGIGDASEGLTYQTWRTAYEDGVVYAVEEGGTRHPLFERPGVTELSLCFYQSMAPFVAFTDGEGSSFWWLNTSTGTHEFFPYLEGPVDGIKCTLDDPRPLSSSTSDIIVSYVRNRNLYFRQQRDNFGDEKLLAENAGSRLIHFGANRGLRLQFRLRP